MLTWSSSFPIWSVQWHNPRYQAWWSQPRWCNTCNLAWWASRLAQLHISHPSPSQSHIFSLFPGRNLLLTLYAGTKGTHIWSYRLNPKTPCYCNWHKDFKLVLPSDALTHCIWIIVRNAQCQLVYCRHSGPIHSGKIGFLRAFLQNPEQRQHHSSQPRRERSWKSDEKRRFRMFYT